MKTLMLIIGMLLGIILDRLFTNEDTFTYAVSNTHLDTNMEDYITVGSPFKK